MRKSFAFSFLRWSVLLPLLFLWGQDAISAYSEHESRFPSTYTALPTPNTHEVTPGVLRGGSPRSLEDLVELKKHGVEQILIFKKEKNNEVDREIEDAISIGYRREQIQHINMPWAGLKSFKPACEMMKDGLRALQSASKANQKIFFHCSVGEDRTGALSALWRLWNNPDLDPEDLFYSEMCRFGFAEANPAKSAPTIREIHDSLGRLYFAMAPLVASLRQQEKPLEDLSCPDLLFFTLPRYQRTCVDFQIR